MTLLQMEYFIEVCKSGSTLQAAQTLNVSQSTISAAVKNLEQELHVPLFQRTSKGMTPNEAGNFFRSGCEKILAQVQTLVSELEQFAPVMRPIRFGIPVQLNQMYWTDLYLALKTAFPQLEFQSVNRTVPVLFELLRRNELDGILLLTSKQNVPDNSLLLREETCRYVSLSVHHPLAGESCLSYGQLLKDPVLRYTGDDLKFQILTQHYQKFGAVPKSGQRFDQLFTLLQFLRKNIGIAYLHKEITKPFPDLVSIPVAEESGHYYTYLVWSKNGVLSRMPKSMFQVFINFFRAFDT